MQFELSQTVGEVVAKRPHLSRIFESVGIDYCCGGKKSIEEASRKHEVDPQELLSRLERAEASRTSESEGAIPAEMSLTELVDHIEQAHHGYLRSELPRLGGMTSKVAQVHGEQDSRLLEIHNTLVALSEELISHMMKEEQVLFPMIRELDSSQRTPMFHCGTLSNPIYQMESEHDNAASQLSRLRSLTDDFTPPEWACNTYRAMASGLHELESDLHQHIHKENNVLFPRAIEMEQVKSQG